MSGTITHDTAAGALGPAGAPGPAGALRPGGAVGDPTDVGSAGVSPPTGGEDGASVSSPRTAPPDAGAAEGHDQSAVQTPDRSAAPMPDRSAAPAPDATGASLPRSDGGGWRLNVLGPVQLCYDERPVEASGTTRTLLVLLARVAGEEVGTGSLIAGIWGSEPPEDAENAVAVQVSRLRKALTAVAPDEDPTKVVVTLPAGYILAVPAPNVDVVLFERLVADGRRALAVGQPRLAVDRLDAALRLWRGEAYQDVRDHAVARAEAARLEDLRLAALELRVSAVLAVAAPSAPESLVAELDELIAAHWHRERLWAGLMTVLYRLGRRSEALAAHRQAQIRLAQELAAEPGPELAAVERAVLANDPALLGTPLAPASPPPELAGTQPPCVGRAEEADWLEAALDLAATRRAQARLIVGSPGIGKTRLVAEVAQRAAARGVSVTYGTGTGTWVSALACDPDRLSLVAVDDLDLAAHGAVGEVTDFIRSTRDRPVLTLITSRDAVRVGDLAALPKLVLTALDDAAIAEIVRIYAPATSDATAVAAMVNTGGVPARLHRAASEWAFARAGRRIDRAVAVATDHRRALATVRREVRDGVLELAYVRAQARRLLPAPRAVAAPYKGLARYETADAAIFHGRERLVAELVARLVEAPMLALVGGAGTGKSSVVRAGLLPALAAGVLPESGSWRPVVVTPSTTQSLAGRIAAARIAPATPTVGVRAGEDVAPDDVEPHDVSPAGTASTESPGAVPADGDPADPLRTPADDTQLQAPTTPHSGPLAEAAAAPLVVVVDQFEEVFTELSDDRRAAFLADLVAAGETDRVVLTMRSEFYPRCAEHPRLVDLVGANTVLIPPMTADELRRAVTYPAALAGWSIADRVVDAIVHDAQHHPGELAPVSLALAAMWERGAPTEEAYRAAGGVGDAVKAFAESGYATLAAGAPRAAARRMLQRLVDRRDGILVRRRVEVTSLLDEAGPHGPNVLAVMAERRLVEVEEGVEVHGDGDGETARLANDALLSGWPRLREWLEDAATERELRRHLVRSAAAWEASDGGREGLYRGVRLAAASDWADKHEDQVTDVEREFLAASRSVALAGELRRRRRTALLWRWVIALVLALVAAVAVSAVSVAKLAKAQSIGERADAARLAGAARGEADLRLGMLLAVAAARLDPDQAPAIMDVLRRVPDLAGAAGSGVTALAVSPDGATLAIGSADGAVILVGPDAVNPVTVAAGRRLERPGQPPVGGLQFTPDGRRVVSWGAAGSGEGSIAVWDVTTGGLVGSPFGEVGADAAGGLLADGATLLLADGGAQPATVAWSLDARTPSTAYELPATPADGIAVSAGGVVAWGTAEGTIVVDPVRATSRGVAGAHNPVALSPDGQTLLTVDATAVHSWAVGSGARTGSALRHGADVLTAAWSPDGRSFATADADGLIVVWDAGTLRPDHVFTGSRRPVRVIRFSADGDALFTAGDDGAAVSWDLTGTAGIGARLEPQMPPAALIGLACALAGRDLTPAEWSKHMPDRSYRHVCP